MGWAAANTCMHEHTHARAPTHVHTHPHKMLGTLPTINFQTTTSIKQNDLSISLFIYNLQNLYEYVCSYKKLVIYTWNGHQFTTNMGNDIAPDIPHPGNT